MELQNGKEYIVIKPLDGGNMTNYAPVGQKVTVYDKPFAFVVRNEEKGDFGGYIGLVLYQSEHAHLQPIGEDET